MNVPVHFYFKSRTIELKISTSQNHKNQKFQSPKNKKNNNR